MNTQTFSLGQILSVTTGVLCVDDINQMKLLMSFMLHGESIWTLGMGRIADEITPYLLEQHPQLAEVKKDDLIGHSDFFANFQQFIDKYGNEFECIPMHLEDHEKVSEVEEIRRRGLNPIVINVDID